MIAVLRALPLWRKLRPLRRSVRSAFVRSSAWISLAAAGLAPATASAELPISFELRAALARSATLELDVKHAHEILDDADLTDPALAIERARLAIYEADCDKAVELLARSDLQSTDEGKYLGDIARGCARGTAATVVVEDKEKGIWVRLQDDDDAALVPLIADVAARAREALARDLGVRLPSPVRIDLVRDQFTLSAMTGLPEEAARTTGTVAIAKWGRVTMISPRAASSGYAWMDTMAHELSHLALTAGTRDKAPLWLQEGVAKREETRWREGWPHDDLPHPDAFAAVGLSLGLGRPLTKLGPSIAMLPSAEEAAVAFAEVGSFVRFFLKETGDDALAKVVENILATNDTDPAANAIQKVSGMDLAAWDARWREYLQGVPKDIPAEMRPGSATPNLKPAAKHFRLGQLLADRDHHKNAAIHHAAAQALAPWDPSIRCHLAASLLATGDAANAEPLVAKPDEVHGRHGRYWSLHGSLVPPPKGDPRAFSLGIALDPLSPEVACEEKAPPETPSDPLRKALCEAARRVPR